MAAKTDKPISVTTKNRKPITIVVDGKKHAFPATVPLDLALVLMNVEGETPDQFQVAQIVSVFRDQVLPADLRENVNDLESVMKVFEAWFETVGLEPSSTGAPTNGSPSNSSKSIEVK